MDLVISQKQMGHFYKCIQIPVSYLDVTLHLF